MVNDSRSPIPHVEEKKKLYTAWDVKKSNHAIQFQHINNQPINRILNEVDNNILKNLPILRGDVGMYEEIYGPIVTHF